MTVLRLQYRCSGCEQLFNRDDHPPKAIVYQSFLFHSLECLEDWLKTEGCDILRRDE
jgi:hypothetical protein